MAKPIASLSLDLDNKWSYMRTQGVAGWELFPSYLDVVVPRYLRLIDELGLNLTVFVVGQDAALEKNRSALEQIPAAGREIANHSFHHEPWMQLHSVKKIDQELAEAEHHIHRATGQWPVGFRGPGFCRSESLCRVLVQRGYAYDASTFPTILGPLARMYFFFHAHFNKTQLEQRKDLYGHWRDALQPNQSYWLTVNESPPGGLVEIPVTTMPLARVPIHGSYLLYLGQFSRLAALTYWRKALFLCRLFGVEPSLLLHPLDILGCDDEQDLSFFPAMNLTAKYKIGLMREILALLADKFDVGTMAEHAAHTRKRLGKPCPLPSSACGDPSAQPLLTTGTEI